MKRIYSLLGLGIAIALSLSSCNKNDIEPQTIEDNTKQQTKIVSGVDVGTKIQFYELPYEYLNEQYYFSWINEPTVGPNQKYATTVIRSYSDFCRQFNGNGLLYDFGIDFQYHTIIVSKIYCPNYNPTLKKEVLSSPYSIQLKVNVSYGNIVSPSVDNQILFIIIPKINDNQQVYTTVTYGNQFPPILQPVL